MASGTPTTPHVGGVPYPTWAGPKLTQVLALADHVCLLLLVVAWDTWIAYTRSRRPPAENFDRSCIILHRIPRSQVTFCPPLHLHSSLSLSPLSLQGDPRVMERLSELSVPESTKLIVARSLYTRAEAAFQRQRGHAQV